MSLAPAEKLAPATGVRFGVLGLLCALAMITYMDRAANGSAKTAIMADLNANGSSYTKDDFFIVLMAFQLAYALFEIPSGWLGDTRGPRGTLLRVVIWWTAFVALTGLTGLTLPGGFYVGFGALVVMQFLFGVGEAGAFPNISKALYNWFPAADRGFAKSAVWSAARCMGGLTPLVWLLVTGSEFLGLTWRQAMWLFAAVAGVWCVAFYAVFRNKPAEHPGVNAAELAVIDAGRPPVPPKVVVPWGQLVRSRNLWCICLMYVVTNFCWYFLMYYLPDALREQYQGWTTTALGKVQLALLAGSPLLVGMLGCLLGGTLSDRYIKRTGDRKWGRRLPGMVGYGLAGVCYLLAAGAKVAAPDNLFLFAGLLILMGFCNDLIMAPAWAVCQDVGRNYAATVSGAMNMFGNLVGAVSGIFVTGLILKRYPTDKSADGILICFTLYAAVYFVGVGLWLLIDPTKPVVDDQAAAGSN
jgi:MFS family permease